MGRMIVVALWMVVSLFAEEVYQFEGKHFMASYLDCDPEALSNVEEMILAMDGAVSASGATLLNKAFHVFPPNGLTIVYLLSESHASLHTYPENGACFVDLFTCGDHCSPDGFDAALRQYLKPKEVNVCLFGRNENFHKMEYYSDLNPD